MKNFKFTTEIILITFIPILFYFISLLIFSIYQIENLSKTTASITKDGLEKIYKTELEERSKDIAEKVSLKLDIVKNELNILRGTAQHIIDNDLAFIGEKMQEVEYLKNSFQYNKEKNWSNLQKNDIDITISVWGYLHNKNGEFNKETSKYIEKISPLKPLMSSIGKYGIEKSWFYVTGPKTTPLMIITPWAEIPKIFDEKYPGHNSNNWWDFFFPGIVEGWELWISNPKLRPKSFKDEITLTPLYEDAGGTGLMVTFFAPLWNKERTHNEGAASLDYQLKHISNLVENEVIAQSGFSFLVQSDGSVLDVKDKWKRTLLGLHEDTNSSREGVTTMSLKLTQSRIDDVRKISEKLDYSNFSIHSIKDDNGKEFFLSFKKIETFNLWTGNGSELKEESIYLGMIVPKNEILKVHYQIEEQIEIISKNTILYSIVVSILLILIVVILIVLFTVKETKQIRILNEAAKDIQEKNFNISVPVVSKNDVGELAETFNHMIETIQLSYQQLETYTQELEKKVEERTEHLRIANEELERLAQFDGLTNLFNRRALDHNLDVYWRKNQRNQTPLSFLIIDIDYFKKYNDTYGHLEGDKCLKDVAQSLKNTLKRPTDFVARYGGEEFGVIIDGDSEQALNIAEFLRKTIEELNIPHKTSDKGIVSISIGVNTLIPSAETTISNFIVEADQALYQSKENGRDQVTLYV
jgi:sigma-B regulation protein RsbU (phosphoserine phosphatase)